MAFWLLGPFGRLPDCSPRGARIVRTDFEFSRLRMPFRIFCRRGCGRGGVPRRTFRRRNVVRAPPSRLQLHGPSAVRCWGATLPRVAAPRRFRRLRRNPLPIFCSVAAHLVFSCGSPALLRRGGAKGRPQPRDAAGATPGRRERGGSPVVAAAMRGGPCSRSCGFFSCALEQSWFTGLRRRARRRPSSPVICVWVFLLFLPSRAGTIGEIRFVHKNGLGILKLKHTRTRR